MLRLRPYRASDADVIVMWIQNEVAFRKWAADRYEEYPILPGDINANNESTHRCYRAAGF